MIKSLQILHIISVSTVSAFWLSVEIIASEEWTNFHQAQAFSYQTDSSISFLKNSSKGDYMSFLGKPLINIFVRKSSQAQHIYAAFPFTQLSLPFLKLLNNSCEFYLPNTFPICSFLSTVLLFQNSTPVFPSHRYKRSLFKCTLDHLFLCLKFF